jgi:hypothetical protein
MVRSDNDRCQKEIDQGGYAGIRLLNVCIYVVMISLNRVPDIFLRQLHSSSFTNPEYELISLHPEHFLPHGAILPIYDPVTRIYKNYVSSRDQCLRESIEPDSARLPPFRHVFQNRNKFYDMNIFLVAINTEIKFRRYFKMIEQHPPTTALPDDVLSLMRRVIELVDLLY